MRFQSAIWIISRLFHAAACIIRRPYLCMARCTLLNNMRRRVCVSILLYKARVHFNYSVEKSTSARPELFFGITHALALYIMCRADYLLICIASWKMNSHCEQVALLRKIDRAWACLRWFNLKRRRRREISKFIFIYNPAPPAWWWKETQFSFRAE